MFKSSKGIGKTKGLLILLLALTPLALKFYTITGNVKDVHEGGNIENAEVIVQDYNDSTRIDTAYTDVNGDFSLEWAFNQAPVIYNVSPEDDAINVSTSPELKVIGEDPDNDSLNIEFYKASNDSLIGSDNIQSGDTASVGWESLDNSTLYEWYVKATDGGDVTQSGTWSFTTESGGGITEGMVENLQISADGNILKVGVVPKLYDIYIQS